MNIKKQSKINKDSVFKIFNQNEVFFFFLNNVTSMWRRKETRSVTNIIHMRLTVS